MQTDIIIIGSGISAKLAALSLALNKFKILVVPNRINDVNQSNLVTFFSSGSIEFLSNILNNSSSILQYETIKELLCGQHNHNDQIFFDLNFNNKNKELLGKIIPNDVINKLLDKHISLCTNINILNDGLVENIICQDHHVEIISQKSGSIFSKLIIFADGKNSIARQFSDIEFVTHDFDQTALSIIAEVERKNKNIAYQCFTTDGPLALLPYSEKQSSVVWSLKKNSNRLKLDKSKLEEEIKRIFGNIINNFRIINVKKFDLSFSFAKKLFSKRLVVIGDTAHSIHPIAGQGLNLIIKDIDCLTRQLKRYKSLGYDLGESGALDEYNKLRKSDNVAYSFGTLIMDEVFSIKNDHIRKFTNSLFKTINKSEMLKQYFVNSATGSNYFNSH